MFPWMGSFYDHLCMQKCAFAFFLRSIVIFSALCLYLSTQGWNGAKDNVYTSLIEQVQTIEKQLKICLIACIWESVLLSWLLELIPSRPGVH